MALHHRNHCHGNQILLMDQYAVCSQMASWNPDWKIMLGLISLLGCIGSKTGLISVAVGLCMAVLTHKWGRSGVAGLRENADHSSFLRYPQRSCNCTGFYKGSRDGSCFCDGESIDGNGLFVYDKSDNACI